MSSDRSITAYYADVKGVELLTADREKVLFAAYRTCTKCARGYVEGATQKQCPTCGQARSFWAREQLAEGALRFVVKVARDYVRKVKGERRGEELLLTLISAGNLGLLIAIDRFETAKGTRFLTYAAWWVREKILEELDNMGLVRVPAYQQKAQRARWRNSQGEPEAPFVTLEPMAEIDRDNADTSCEKELLNSYGAAAITRVLKRMRISTRDQYAVMLYIGAREEPKSLKQIAARVGYTTERVRAVKRHVLQAAKSALSCAGMDDLDDVFD